TLGRLGGCLAGVWVGLMAGVGLVAAPLLFASLPRVDAQRLAAQLFSLDATIGICIGALLVMIGLQLARGRAERGAGSRFGPEFALALAALLCIVVGYYALQPMMEAARIGTGSLSFGALHGIATSLFLLRLALAAVLAWLLAKPAA
ncbi:MAG: DUF4149 domain-containing protein, partial [Pseudomonadota bacterium]|nr:DUF4149 domain-containing protein [Pseudomonadota bacterium]